jgi:SRSO17 transposase
MSKRQPTTPAPGLLEEYSQWFDGLFCKVNQREGFRQYLTGLLLASERNKTLTGIANSEPVVGAQESRVQSLQWYLSESTWEAAAVNRARVELILNTPGLKPHEQGALVIDETGEGCADVPFVKLDTKRRMWVGSIWRTWAKSTVVWCR